MRPFDLHHLHAVLLLWLAMARWLLWFTLCGLIACGATWCVAVASRRAWFDAYPRPDLKAELRIRREVTHGLRAMEHYLDSPDHAE